MLIINGVQSKMPIVHVPYHISGTVVKRHTINNNGGQNYNHTVMFVTERNLTRVNKIKSILRPYLAFLESPKYGTKRQRRQK